MGLEDPGRRMDEHCIELVGEIDAHVARIAFLAATIFGGIIVDRIENGLLM
jgi:hypothetical protein